jgi:hypothetical protein
MNNDSVRPSIVIRGFERPVNVAMRQCRENAALRNVGDVYFLTKSYPEGCLTKATSDRGTFLGSDEYVGSKEMAFDVCAI